MIFQREACDPIFLAIKSIALYFTFITVCLVLYVISFLYFGEDVCPPFMLIWCNLFPFLIKCTSIKYLLIYQQYHIQMTLAFSDYIKIITTLPIVLSVLRFTVFD
jgi:hypothetical protein